jgi:hypothetical protein
MEHREGLFLVAVEARRLGGHHEDQLAAAARLFLGHRLDGQEQDGDDQHGAREARQHTGNRLSHDLLTSRR